MKNSNYFIRAPEPKSLRNKDVPFWLRQSYIDKDSFLKKSFLKTQFLMDSLFYACAGNDPKPVKFWSGLFHSFIYMDSLYDDEWIYETTKPHQLSGYECYLFEKIPLLDEETIENLWMQMEKTLRSHLLKGKEFYLKNWSWKIFEEEFRNRNELKSYAYITLHKRLEEFPPEHGPEFLSLCLISGGAITHYYYFYYIRGLCPRGLCTHFPGMCDWMQIQKPNAPFQLFLRSRTLPKYSVYESYIKEYSDLIYSNKLLHYPPLYKVFQKRSFVGEDKKNL